MSANSQEPILSEITSVEEGNLFLQYIVRRLRSDEYRGWHVSQHNRYTMNDMEAIMRAIYRTVQTRAFAIPPGDYGAGAVLPAMFADFAEILSRAKKVMGKATINSLKKNFFIDLDRMGFLNRMQIRVDNKLTWHGELTSHAVEFLNVNNDLVAKYKKFTDGIDKIFGNKISQLAELLSLSDYNHDAISIYEFMFILSDQSENLDKIEILDSYRSLKQYQRENAISLIKQYADPTKFAGDKTNKRDFHNWKNQAQQIMILLKATVYFEVEPNKYLRLNTGTTGFFEERPRRRAGPKRQYFAFHGIQKKAEFELHHIVPISLARNKTEAKVIDDHLNLIYIHRVKHKEISKRRNENVVLSIDPANATFSNFQKSNSITAKNKKDAFYSDDKKKVKKMASHNAGLLKSIFGY